MLRGPSVTGSRTRSSHQPRLNFDLSEGETGSHEFVVIVHVYYTPEQRGGDAAELAYPPSIIIG